MVRIGGLASGMDIDTMVSDLMKAERVPLDKLKQKKQTLEWQRDDYRTMNTQLLNFRTELTTMKLSSTYRSRGTTSTDESKVTATATSNASLASYSISKVDQLATAASKVTKVSISEPGTKVDLNKTFKELETVGSFKAAPLEWKSGSAVSSSTEVLADGKEAQLTLADGKTIDTSAFNTMNVKVNGKALTVVGTLGDVSTTANSVYVDSTGKLTFSDNVTKGSTVKVDYVTPGTGTYSSFSIKTYSADGNPVMENFNINSDETMDSVISKVNSSTVGVTMFYDNVSDKMTLTRKETGKFTTGPDEIVTSGHIINTLFKFGGADAAVGTNAKFTINGLATERTSNNFEISGVTFALKKPFTDAPASINISNNTNQIYDNIKGFIDKYNELIGKIQSEVQEDRYKAYTPLTDEQRETLSDKQQEQWEEKAKSGLLRRDPTLSNLLTKMRLDFGNPVSNQEVSPMFKQLSSIGITTSPNYLEGGKLTINEAELKKAIEADPTAVEKLFSATGTTSAEKGIAQRLTDTINTGLEKLRSKAGNAFTTNKQFELGKILDDIDNKIDRFEERMTKVEDRYWARFTAMEKAIQRSNEQMAQLSNFSG